MKRKFIHAHIDAKFYEKVEDARKKFMAKHKLTKLSTIAFTRMLGNSSMKIKLPKGKNERKKRRC